MEVKGTTYQRIVVGAGYLLFILAIIFQKQLGINSAASGMFLVALMALFKGLPLPTLVKAIKPGFLLQSAAILTAVSLLGSSGAGEVLIQPVTKILGTNPSPTLVVAIFYMIAAILTQFMVNQYTATLLIPLAIPYCVSIGLDPRGVVMAILMGCNNCGCTPTATTANLVTMQDGYIEFGDYLKPGLVMMVVGLVVNITILPLIWY